VIIPDHHIRKAQADLNIIEPFVSEHVQPASVDLTLSEDVQLFGQSDQAQEVGLSLRQPQSGTIGQGVISPGQFLLGSTREKITMPADMVGQINGRSSWARLGLIVENAGFIDPGFSGTITLELKNVGHRPIKIRAGDRICQLVLSRMAGRAEQPYGSPGLGSSYQGQEGPTLSAIDRA